MFGLGIIVIAVIIVIALLVLFSFVPVGLLDISNLCWS